MNCFEIYKGDMVALEISVDFDDDRAEDINKIEEEIEELIEKHKGIEEGVDDANNIWDAEWLVPISKASFLAKKIKEIFKENGFLERREWNG